VVGWDFVELEVDEGGFGFGFLEGGGPSDLRFWLSKGFEEWLPLRAAFLVCAMLGYVVLEERCCVLVVLVVSLSGRGPRVFQVWPSDGNGPVSPSPFFIYYKLPVQYLCTTSSYNFLLLSSDDSVEENLQRPSEPFNLYAHHLALNN